MMGSRRLALGVVVAACSLVACVGRAPWAPPEVSKLPGGSAPGGMGPAEELPLQAPQGRPTVLALAQATAQLAPVLAKWQLRPVGKVALDGLTLVKLELPLGWDLATAQAHLSGLPGLVQLSQPARLQAFAAPNDPSYGKQWGHRPEFADAEGGWAALGATQVGKTIVAVLDSGVDRNHPEFEGRLEDTILQDSQATQADPKDHYGHGTLCAGVIAAAGNNAQGMAGLAWQARILPVKLGPGANFDVFDAIAGVAKACDHQGASGARVRVINMSFGIPQGAVDPLYEAAVAYAKRRGVLIVAAVGNDGQNTIASPANTPGVLAVGATTLSRDWEVVAPFSNYGARLDLLAPGGLTLSTTPTDTNPTCELCLGVPGYALNSGTSFAAPYVAGVAALVFAKHDPNHASLADPAQAAAMVEAVRKHLLASCDDLGPPGWDPVHGHGRINVKKAISASSLQSPP